MPPLALDTIRQARTRLADAIYHSPCPYSLSLSRLCKCPIYCKLEHLQMTGSFKERGARNKLLLLTPEQKSRGVIAASAGNHALGLAYHAQLLNIPVTVVMPKWAPLVKIQNAKNFNATILLHGETFDEALQFATAQAHEKSLTYVPGFDDPDIIAGTATIGLEILEDVPDVEAIIVPVGGGGLVAGIASAVKALKPHVQIIGAEPANAPTLAHSLKAHQVTRAPTAPTLADGLAVTQIGALCLDIIQNTLDQLVLVDETQLAQSILRLLELEKMVVEGAGAAPLAALLSGQLNHLQNKKTVLVLSGGNIDVTLISRIIERGLAADGRLTRIVVHISDRPGSLAKVLALIAQTGASIKEVSHDRNFGPADVAQVYVACILETRDADHIKQIHQTLTNAHIQVAP